MKNKEIKTYQKHNTSCSGNCNKDNYSQVIRFAMNQTKYICGMQRSSGSR